MADVLPPCPACQSPYAYELGALLVCPECAHEWSAADAATDAAPTDEDIEVRDSAGNVLADGDTVTVIKQLRVKGGGTIKVGTRVRGIRLVNGVGDHDIECKIDGIGQTQLKSSVVKKAL